ncbi:hypothetical protein [Mycolicibacterium fortuitum]|uniref:hypothetical protein n=1 Tax=Mycolicibacterium fortuitum TaxID=1766 RepID=UPI001CE10093|nr:hypothetical protein [Mycolicibacterium fortuitum]MCA4726887.1 hypothetical protein [Mycolicibacterium fortuitum]
MDDTAVDKRKMRAAGVHEAGHAIAAALHGGIVRRAEVLRSGRTITASGVTAAVAGYTRYKSEVPNSSASALVAAAGTAAEAMFWHGTRPTAAQLDVLLRKNTHDLAVLRPHAYRADRPLLDAVFDAMPLVRRCWGPIVNLALELEQGNAIQHRDVLAALGIPAADETEAYAAAIRGGQTPGTFALTAAAG